LFTIFWTSIKKTIVGPADRLFVSLAVFSGWAWTFFSQNVLDRTGPKMYGPCRSIVYIHISTLLYYYCNGFDFTKHGVLHAKVAKITYKKRRRRSRYSIFRIPCREVNTSFADLYFINSNKNTLINIIFTIRESRLQYSFSNLNNSVPYNDIKVHNIIMWLLYYIFFLLINPRQLRPLSGFLLWGRLLKA